MALTVHSNMQHEIVLVVLRNTCHLLVQLLLLSQLHCSQQRTTTTMSSNSQSQETADNKTAAPSPAVQDRNKVIENFAKELVVDCDFKLNESGDIVMIRHLHVSKCTVPLLRQICFGSKCRGTKTRVKSARWDS